MGKHASGSSAITTLLPTLLLPLLLPAAVLFVCIPTAHGKEVVHGTVSNFTADPSVSGAADTDALPSSFAVDVTLGGRRVHLRLNKDRTVQPQLPLFALSTDREGVPRVQRATLGDTEYAVFSDTVNEAAFGVYRDKDNSGASVYKLEGIVHSSGKIYDLRSTGRPRRQRQQQQQQQQRRRRDAHQGSDDGTADANNNTPAATAAAAATSVDSERDRGKMMVEGQGGEGEREEEEEEGEEEEEEFEVDILSDDSAAPDPDSLPKPLSFQHRREMQDMTRPMPVSVVPPPPFSLSQPSPPSPPSTPSPPSPPSHRKKREITRDVYIDVVVLADYGVYSTWYGRSTETTAAAKQLDTLQKIRRYYAFVMNGVNTLYKSIDSLSYTITVRLAGVVVSTMPSSSDWTERFRVNRTQWDEVDAKQSLAAVKDWAGTTDLLPSYDHLMVFSGYDLSKTVDGVVSDKITGLAYTGTVCDTNGQASSIVEDLGGFQCIGTAAHELGHGLSAEHDGVMNACQSEDRYVMAQGTFPVNDVNKLNPWKFSACSVTYFNSFLAREVTSARGVQCVYGMAPINANVPDVTSSTFEGQLYDADEQCRQVYGPQSRLCRGPEFGEAADVCTDMFCYDPSSTATCYQLVAARGTTCGNQKWCENGQCVSNSAAPTVQENCVFGDQPGTAFDNKDCETFVDNFPGYCYQDVVRVRCCSSCARHYRLLQDCDYGDRATGCTSFGCSRGSDSYLSSCCGTCNHGTPLTSTTTTTLAPPPTVTTTTNPAGSGTSSSSSSSAISTSAPSVDGTTTTPEPCTDSTTTTVNMMECDDLVSANPELCYDSRVLSLCCRSCSLTKTAIAGCEYGDRRPSNCSAVQADRDACSRLQPLCCETCFGYETPSGRGERVNSALPCSLLLFLSALTLLLSPR